MFLKPLFFAFKKTCKLSRSENNHVGKYLANAIEIIFYVFPFLSLFFSVLSESLNIFRVFTQWPLTFLPVSCRIDVGHNDHGYQQPSYPEQGYDRPYEDSSQHYYEGGIAIPSHVHTHALPQEPAALPRPPPVHSSRRAVAAACLESYREPRPPESSLYRYLQCVTTTRHF